MIARDFPDPMNPGEPRWQGAGLVCERGNVGELRDQPGSVPVMLGRYEILGKLGTGGMATVYLARNAGDHGFQRMCAVKVLHPHLSEDIGFIQMLLDEAKIAARLHHPNVVPIVDLGQHDSVLYVAMECVEGCSLSALLKKSPNHRPPHLLVSIVLDALAGLDSAHTLTDDDGNPLSLVHRDVSPQNVLIGVDGAARITDFGIARASSRITTTRPGQLKGKIAYKSPEQIRSAPVDRRADIFSAGAMLWSALTGRKLFVADNDAATMSNILHLDIPNPSEIGLEPPPALDAVCLRALERDPDKRFQSAREMEDALRAAADACGANGTRREVGEWIASSFRDELAARRKAVRDTGARTTAERRAVFSSRNTVELPSFTPSGQSLDPFSFEGRARSNGDQSTAVGDTQPAEAPIVTVVRPGRAKLIAVWVAPAVVVIAIALWLGLRRSGEPPTIGGPSVAAPSVAAPSAPPPSVAAPSAAAPTVAAPSAPAPVAPGPSQAEAPPVVAAPSPVAAAPAHPQPSFANRPAAIRRPAAPSSTRPTRPAPTAIAPTVAAPTSPAPPQPAKPTRWDSDSPVPPQ